MNDEQADSQEKDRERRLEADRGINRLYAVIICILLGGLGVVTLIDLSPLAVSIGLLPIIGAIVLCLVIWREWKDKDSKEKKYKPSLCKDDPAYEQVYEEMRRFRNLEYTFLAWYTTMLLAILGAGISLAAKAQKGLPSAVADLAPLVVVGLLLISTIVSYLIWYSNRNYRELRENVKHHYKEPALRVEKVPFKGHYAMQVLLWAVTFVCCSVLYRILQAATGGSH